MICPVLAPLLVPYFKELMSNDHRSPVVGSILYVQIHFNHLVDYLTSIARKHHIFRIEWEEFGEKTQRHFQPESPFKLTVFQGGPRICLGKEFAFRQMKKWWLFLFTFSSFNWWMKVRKLHIEPCSHFTWTMDSPYIHFIVQKYNLELAIMLNRSFVMKLCI